MEALKMNYINEDNLEHLKTLPDNMFDSVVCDPPYGLAFMGKRWDYDVPSVELWREVLRVLKPGGHLLSFGGTRTYHRMVVNIEDAGFEIRDQLQWLYGQGFPKSLDVSKAIDKKFGAEREVVGENPNARPNCQAKQMNTMNGKMHWSPLTAPATDQAEQWQGFGTSLKPANEPIVLARKPLSEKTVADNVLRWGTGAINVDGCRVNAGEDLKELNRANKRPRNGASGFMTSTRREFTPAEGRWPANLIFDETAAQMLGEPSRFFYIAKASKRERNEGLEGMPEIKSDYRPNDDTSTNTIRERLHNSIPKQNHHPTVKPIKLMRYLCKLITPPGGIVLDPFMGSGSTGIGALSEEFGFYGIELDTGYFDIAKARLQYTQKKMQETYKQDEEGEA